jgi:hypothetical protein
MTHPPPPKKVTWKKFVFLAAAVSAGVCMIPLQEFQKTGTLTAETLSTTAVALAIALAIVGAIFAWAARPRS